MLFQWKYEDSFDKNGFDKNGFDKNGFDKNGFDKNGFDIDGFDKDCFHENGFNILGYDKNGFDINGYDKDGVHKDGFDESNYPDYPDLNSDWDTNDYNNKNDYSSADRYIRFSLSKWDNGFWYFGDFSCGIFFLFYPSCQSCLAKCKQWLCNVFVFL